jgi:seryl-tRNA synthetase
MLQIQTLREEKDRVINGLVKKNVAQAAGLVEKAIQIDTERREIQLSLNRLQADLNQKSSSIGALMKEGKKEEAEQSRSEVSTIKTELKNLEEKCWLNLKEMK